MFRRLSASFVALIVAILVFANPASAADADDARHYDFDNASGVRTLTVTLNGCNGGGLSFNGSSWNNKIDAWLSIECSANHYNTFGYGNYLGGGVAFTRTNLPGASTNKTSSISYT